MDDDTLIKERDIEINAILKQKDEMTKIFGNLSALVDKNGSIFVDLTIPIIKLQTSEDCRNKTFDENATKKIE